MGTKTEEGRERTESVAMAVVQQKTKEQKAKAAMSSSKGKKKKWSKGKVKEKSNMAVLVDRLRISGSLARLAVKMLEEEGKIRAITKHSKQWLYTRATNVV